MFRGCYPVTIISVSHLTSLIFKKVDRFQVTIACMPEQGKENRRKSLLNDF